MVKTRVNIAGGEILLKIVEQQDYYYLLILSSILYDMINL